MTDREAFILILAVAIVASPITAITTAAVRDRLTPDGMLHRLATGFIIFAWVWGCVAAVDLFLVCVGVISP